MGLMPVGSLVDYQAAVRKLLPRGEFWDRQLADSSSDVSLWCEAEAAELYRLKLRMVDLLNESILASTSELIDDWERVADVDNSSLDLDVRRRLLQEKKTPNLSPGILQNVADAFGAEIIKISHPFTPAMFGFSRFASRMATAGAWNVIYLYVALDDTTVRKSFKSSTASVLLANNITIFFFRTADDEYVPG